MSKHAEEKQEILATIQRIQFAYWDSRVLLTAVELDIFSALADRADTAAAAAVRVGAAPRAVARLLDALVVLGILSRDGDRYVLDPGAADLLVPGRADYQGGLRHAANLWNAWGTLTDAVRAGTSVKPKREGAARVAHREDFIAAMDSIGTRRASVVVGSIDLTRVRRVLDVGGASGAYAMEFVCQGDGLRAAVFDLPDVLPLTRRYIQEARMADRVDTVPGDYLVDGFGEGWDLILLSNIIHINDPAENADLILRAAAALAPRGRVVIQDFVPEDDRTGPRFPVLFALNMLVNTRGGDTYTLPEIRAWTDAAGFEWLEPVETDVPSTLVMCQRPS